MDNISDIALFNSLKELQEDDIVIRHQYNKMPVRVEYSLSKKGKTLIPVLDVISTLAFHNSDISLYKGKHFEKFHRSSFKPLYKKNIQPK